MPKKQQIVKIKLTIGNIVENINDLILVPTNEIVDAINNEIF